MSALRTSLNWLLWTAIVIGSIFFLWTDVFAYLRGYRSPSFGNSLLNNQFIVVVHLVGGTAGLLCGPFQFWERFREQQPKVHRWMGKVYIIGGLLVGFSALRSSLISKCVPCRVSLFITAALLLITLITAWLAIKNKHVKQHRQFMVRSYVLMLAFVLVRIDGIVPMDFLFGSIEDPTFRRTVNEYFFSFVPLLVTEVLMIWRPYMMILKSR
jgi:uncharacterized membrane protein